MDYSKMMIANSLGTAVTSLLKLPAETGTILSMFILKYGTDIEIGRNHVIISVVCWLVYTYAGVFKNWWFAETTLPPVNSTSVTLKSSKSFSTLSYYMTTVTKDVFGSANYDYDHDTSTGGNVRSLSSGQTIKFTDTDGTTKIEGMIVVTMNATEKRSEVIAGGETKETSFKKKQIAITRTGGGCASEYFSLIESRVTDHRNASGDISLTHFTHDRSGATSTRTSIYQGPKKSLDELERAYMGTFFCREKEYLITLAKAVTYSREIFEDVGQVGAMNLILHGPPGTGKSTFAYRLAMMLSRGISSIDVSNLKNADAVRTAFMAVRYSIIVLEEFDRSIKVIEENERKIAEEGNTITKPDGTTYTSTVSTFKVSDLLELLQGPVPVPGRIIIATTNHLEEMQAKYPALFRPGRLTPVYFGYLDRTQISELSRVYFGESLEIDYDPNIATSHIIDIAIRARLVGGIDYFEKELRRVSTIKV